MISIVTTGDTYSIAPWMIYNVTTGDTNSIAP